MRWILKPIPNKQLVNQLVEELGLQKSLAQILAQRGIVDFQSAKNYFRPQLEHLHNPLQMKDMQKAVHRILQALEEDQKILIYGDYDVDGTTSVAMVYRFFRELGSRVDFYIPDRYSEGYGISEQGIRWAKEHNFQLIIALDCGIRAIDMVHLAGDLGIDMIICDHHQPGENLPQAIAVLDPKRADCLYPFKELSGCGVGFKLLQALCAELGLDPEILIGYLDYVALSIAADIVPMVGENRILAYFGLQIIQESPRLFITAFVQKSPETISIEDLVFQVAPRINAAGRIKHARLAVELLISEDQKFIAEQAAKITELNQIRKNLDAEITTQADEMVQKEPDAGAVVVYRPDWHKGVLGIVASRLVEKHYKPSVVFTKSNEKLLVASARSIPNFDLYGALVQCEDFLEKFGGHTHAAGLSILESNFEDFKRHFCQVVSSSLKEQDKQPYLDIDLPIELQEITPKFLRILQQFGPFGPGNMNPVFLARNLKIQNLRTMGREGDHLRFEVVNPVQSSVFVCVAFGRGADYNWLSTAQFIDLVFSIEKNYWNGNVYTQLMVKDLRLSGNSPGLKSA